MTDNEDTAPTAAEVAEQVQATVDKAAADGNKLAKKIQKNMERDKRRGR